MKKIVETILQEISVRRMKTDRFLIAIDGRCGSGKTTLAQQLQNDCQCNIIHMDDFFLTPELRTQERLNEPGGNVDYDRFLKEVLLPLCHGGVFKYRPYDCLKKEMADPITIHPLPVNIIEGSYSCHPTLFRHYDLRIFLTINKTEQLQRIRKRNGEVKAVQFQELWIPLEEKYFSSFNIKDRFELCFETAQATVF